MNRKLLIYIYDPNFGVAASVQLGRRFGKARSYALHKSTDTVMWPAYNAYIYTALTYDTR